MPNNDGLFSGKEVFVTGGTGFIGSNLVRRLVKENAKVFVGIRKKSNLWRLEGLHDKISILEIDLFNPDLVKHKIQSIDPQYIFHFAMPSYLQLKNEFDYQQQLNQTTGNLINLLHAVHQYSSRLKSFVHACSSTIHRWEENKYLLSEKTPFDPITFRGMLKLNERNICQQYARKHSLPIKLGRIFRAYGPWDTSQKLIVTALNALKNNTPFSLTNDKFKRDYIFIDDLVQGFLELALSQVSPGTEINFGSGNQLSAKEIVKILEEIVAKQIPVAKKEYPTNPYDRGNFIADIDLAKQTLGWQPKTSTKEGLIKTVDWYKNHFQWKV